MKNIYFLCLIFFFVGCSKNNYQLKGKKEFKLSEIIDLIKDKNTEEKIKSVFSGITYNKNQVDINNINLNAIGYYIAGFEIANGICDVISIYKFKDDFVQLELAFQNTTASLKKIMEIKKIKFITSGEFKNGKTTSVNYLFKYLDYAINVVTIKNSQKMGSFYISSDDVFFIGITTLDYYNKTMSESYGVKL